jgi:hypothetical protein
MKSANINIQPKKLFYQVVTAFFLHYFYFLFISTVNVLILRQLGDALVIDVWMAVVASISGSTYWTFQIIHFTILFVVYFKLNIVIDFMASIAEEQVLGDRVNFEGKLKHVGRFMDAICDTLESVKFCFSVSTINYVLQYTFLLTLSTFSVISYAFHSDSSKLDFNYIHADGFSLDVSLHSVRDFYVGHFSSVEKPRKNGRKSNRQHLAEEFN